MPKFESIPPVESIANETETPLEQRKNVIEKLSDKFPGLRSIIFSFLTTTAVMSAPELAEAHEPVEGIKMEQKSERKAESAETALAKIGDKEFKDAVSKLEARLAAVGSEIPTNAAYSYIMHSESINHGNTFNEYTKGSMPESATNIFIGHETVCGFISVDQGGAHAEADMMDGLKSSFHITPAEKGNITEGGKVEINGTGTTREDALRNALDDGVRFLGITVETDASLGSKAEDVGEKYSARNMLSENIRSSGQHFLKTYRVVGGSETKDGMGNTEYIVNVELTGGTFTPEK